MIINMHKDKTTKNSFRFTEMKADPNDPHSKSIYMTKTECETAGIKDNITVTIEPA